MLQKINCFFVGLDQDRVNSKNSILEIIQIQVLEHKLPFGEDDRRRSWWWWVKCIEFYFPFVRGRIPAY